MPNGPEKGLTTLAVMAVMLLLVLLLRPILRAAHAAPPSVTEGTTRNLRDHASAD